MSIGRIESRKAAHGNDEAECEVFVDVECDDAKMTQVCNLLKKRLAYQQNVQESIDGADALCQLEPPGLFYSFCSFLS